MSDYTITTDFSDKDGLTSGDPEKLILGADLEVEFAAIAVAIATKYDSSDIASQAQAEAGASNAVLMTPLRVAQYIAGASGAGIVGDLISLADPNADRILFWDDSAGAAAFLSLGDGLDISNTTLEVTESEIDHDSLLNFVADEHVAHGGVTITGGGGITGGGTIAASRVLTLDVTSLTALVEADLVTTTDLVLIYDASASANKKITAEALAGAKLGDGKWYKNATQSLSAATETTITSYTEAYDELQRGTFDTSAGTYTAGSSGARILVLAQLTIDSLSSGATLETVVQQAGVTKDRDIVRNHANAARPEVGKVAALIVLGSGEAMRIRANPSSAETIASGVEKSSVRIVEIG